MLDVSVRVSVLGWVPSCQAVHHPRDRQLHEGRSISNGNRCIRLKQFTFYQQKRTFSANTNELLRM